MPQTELERIAEIMAAIARLHAAGRWEKEAMAALLAELRSFESLHPVEVKRAFGEVLSGWYNALFYKYRNVVCIDAGRKRENPQLVIYSRRR